MMLRSSRLEVGVARQSRRRRPSTASSDTAAPPTWSSRFRAPRPSASRPRQVGGRGEGVAGRRRRDHEARTSLLAKASTFAEACTRADRSVAPHGLSLDRSARPTWGFDPVSTSPAGCRVGLRITSVEARSPAEPAGSRAPDLERSSIATIDIAREAGELGPHASAVPSVAIATAGHALADHRPRRPIARVEALIRALG